MSSRQPPIRLDLRSRMFKNDPAATWQRLQAEGPIVTTRQPLLGRIALATTHAACCDVLRDTDRFTVDATRAGKSRPSGMQWWVPSSFRTIADNLLVHDGSEHRRLRRQVDHAFRGDGLAGLQPRIDAVTEAALERLGASAEPDWLSVAREVPQQVIGELLGLQDTLGDARPRFDAALSRLASIHGPLDVLRAVPAIRVVTRQLGCEFARRERAPRDDLMTQLLAAQHESADTSTDNAARHLSGTPTLSPQDERVSMAFLLYAAGHETTTHLLSVGLLSVLRDPVVRDSLPRPVTREAVLELMRFVSPVQFTKPRFVTRDLDFHGAELRRGDTIAALVGAANQDPAVFDEPAQLDFTRNPKGQLGFGTGPHGCLGLQLAVQETATTLTRLLERWPAVRLARPERVPDWTRRLGLRSVSTLPIVLDRAQ